MRFGVFRCSKDFLSCQQLHLQADPAPHIVYEIYLSPQIVEISIEETYVGIATSLEHGVASQS